VAVVSLSSLPSASLTSGDLGAIAQADRRRTEERRSDWRGGRRVSDFAYVHAHHGSVPPFDARKRRGALVAGPLH